MSSFKLFVALATLVALFSSCRKDGDYTITATLQPKDVWTAGSKLETNGDLVSMMGIYVFDNSGTYTCFAAANMSQAANFSVTSTRITEAGTYTIYGFTGISSENLLRPANQTITPTSTFIIDDNRDVCLGTQSVTITRSQINYSTTISLNHVMAQLALSVAEVPVDITSVEVTLPNQSNQVNFAGVFSGNATSQTITLTRSATADANGLYTWSFPETIVFPCANGTTSMPITVVATQANGVTYTFNTASSTCCTTGTRTVLSTTWNTLNYNLTAGFSVNPWTTVIQNDTFGLGDPVIS